MSVELPSKHQHSWIRTVQTSSVEAVWTELSERLGQQVSSSWRGKVSVALRRFKLAAREQEEENWDSYRVGHWRTGLDVRKSSSEHGASE